MTKRKKPKLVDRLLERVDPDVVVFRQDKPLVPLLDGSGSWPRAATIDGFAVYCAPRVRDRCV